MTVIEFLNGECLDDGGWRFRLGRELHGAFGGANGGVLAATSVVAARSLAPGRVPAGLDARFLRGLTAGVARVEPTLLHGGRTLSCINVDISDERGALCTRAIVSLVNPQGLAPLDHPGEAGAAPGWASYDAGRPWPEPTGPVEVPLIRTFGPRAVGSDERGIATAIRVPWDEAGTCAEAACIAADISVGPPVARATAGKPIPIPNPDLSLRFCAEASLPRAIVAAARLERISAGLATTRIEVRAGGELVAIGISTTTMLAGAWPNPSRSTPKTASPPSAGA